MTEQLDTIIAAVFDDGPYPCNGCGENMILPGLCDVCAAQRETAENRRKCAEALATLPRTMSWANFASEALLRRPGPNGRPRVEPSADGSDPISWCRRALPPLLKGQARNIVLLGPTSVGKTTLACAMAREVVELDPSIARGMRFYSCVDMSMCRREARWGEGRPKSLEVARSCSLLIFDDLCQETHGADVAIEVIHARYDARLPTIFTTWAKPTEIADKYGGGTSRRVFDLAAVFNWYPPEKSS